MSISTTANLNASISYSQLETNDTNAGLTTRDAGTVSHAFSYTNGQTSGKIDEVFHEVGSLGSGVTKVFDLESLAQATFSGTLTKSFSAIRGITIYNSSVASGSNFNVNVSSGSSFGEPFGYPTGLIPMTFNESLMRYRQGESWVVSAGAGNIALEDAGNGSTYQIVFIGVR